MKNVLILIFGLFSFLGNSQESYLGAGNDDGVKVTTSSNFFNTEGENTINGSGLDAKRMEASRLLAQATIGYEKKHVNHVMSLGIENWLDKQFLEPPSFLLATHDEIFEEAKQAYDDNKSDDDEDYYGPWGLHFNYAWWQTNLTNEDLLRHRVALALSEILVISMNSDLIDFGEGLSHYYDVLLKHSFGNYKDLLKEVSLHPCMGYYLSHLNNPKTDKENNINPDENYAREVMQLFTIGLYELDKDGSRKTNADGNFIPTYDNDDIKEMAKIFTGLGGGDWSDEALEYFEDKDMEPFDIFFGSDIGIYSVRRTVPLKMYNSFHEPGVKTILKKHTIPNGQDGMKDIDDAIDILFNHDNVGPFLGRLLIQRLVKSNPSPAFIKRITKVFENNGKGERGDLAAVVKAILMDEEARSCEWQQDANHGMLREPIVRYAHLCRSLPKDAPLGNFWNNGFFFRELTKQHPLMSPTVFNFFQPEYQPVGDFANENLFGPEFQIHDSRTSIGYINHINLSTIYDVMFFSYEQHRQEDLVVSPELSELVKISGDKEALINELDIMYTHGRLSDGTRKIIREALREFQDPNTYEFMVKLAIYLIMISPDYTILK
ncbi:MAG: DUF1800 family protein [Saprospiraceae bacterium]